MQTLNKPSAQKFYLLAITIVLLILLGQVAYLINHFLLNPPMSSNNVISDKAIFPQELITNAPLTEEDIIGVWHATYSITEYATHIITQDDGTMRVMRDDETTPSIIEANAEYIFQADGTVIINTTENTISAARELIGGGYPRSSGRMEATWAIDPTNSLVAIGGNLGGVFGFEGTMMVFAFQDNSLVYEPENLKAAFADNIISTMPGEEYADFYQQVLDASGRDVGYTLHRQE